jgi:hypothetical protein
MAVQKEKLSAEKKEILMAKPTAATTEYAKVEHWAEKKDKRTVAHLAGLKAAKKE